MKRIDMIGLKKPIEIFQQCLELYGETLQQFNGSSDHEFNSIVRELEKQVSENSDYLIPVTVSQIKLSLNEMLKRGIPTVEDETYLQIVDLISFEPIVIGKTEVIASKVEIDCDEIPKIVFCQKCRDPKTQHEMPSTTARVCSECVSKTNKENSKNSPVTKNKREFQNIKNKSEAPIVNDEDNLPSIKGSGLYQVSVIHKDRVTGQMDHTVFEIESDTKEFAVGKAVLSKEINNDIIIAISYEKIILHTGS